MGRKKSVALIVATLALLTAARAVPPIVRNRRIVREVDALLRDDAFFHAIVTDAPEVREPFRKALIEAHMSDGLDEVRRVANSFLQPLLPRYTGKSADAALVAFGRSLVAVLDEMGTSRSHECYRFLVPAVEGPPRGAMTAKQDAMANALRQVVASARGPAAREQPPDREALKSVIRALRPEHPDVVSILLSPDAARVDRQRVCTVFTELYREIVRRPRAKRQGPCARRCPTLRRARDAGSGYGPTTFSVTRTRSREFGPTITS